MDTLYLLQFTCFLFMLVNILNLGITRLHMKWMNRRYEVSRWLVMKKYVLGVSFPHEGDTFFVGMRHIVGECDTLFQRKTLYLHHEKYNRFICLRRTGYPDSSFVSPHLCWHHD